MNPFGEITRLPEIMITNPLVLEEEQRFLMESNLAHEIGEEPDNITEGRSFRGEQTNGII